MLAPWNLWNRRPAPDSNQNPFRRDGFAIHFNRMGSLNGGTGIIQGDTRLVQQAVINTVQAGDFSILAFHQGCPVKTARPDRPAKTSSFFKIFPIVGGIDHQLFGNTADIDAGSTQISIFRNSHFCAQRRGHTSGPNPAGPGTNYKQIIVIVAHRERHSYMVLKINPHLAETWGRTAKRTRAGSPGMRNECQKPGKTPRNGAIPV